jgi:hypothetical protein
MGGRPDVEIGHLGVRDDVAGDQRPKEIVVLAVGAHTWRATGRGPALPDHRPHAGVAGVLPLEERRAGRQRQQDRQGGLDPGDETHRHVGIVDGGVHLEAADQVLVDEQAVVLLHAAVATAGRELEVGDARQGCGARRGHGETLMLGGADGGTAEGDDLAAQVMEGPAHLGVGLDGAPLQLGGEALVGEPAEQLRGPERQLQGVGVDDLQFLLDAECAGRRHPPTLGSECFGRVSPGGTTPGQTTLWGMNSSWHQIDASGPGTRRRR